ncbi:MAG TPA: SDR family NAD(P)-dependent oxidoreductase [Opitutaceae bacterium]|nr:SDR family NAD(P)-dependent oxidoreductase [Opitutaceae bacterium]
MSRPSLSPRLRTALVTGAGGGLGRAFAEMLRAEGVEVWGTSRRPESLAAAARFHPLGFDLAGGDAAAEALVARVERESGGLDLLVHNAGFGVFGGLLDQPLAVWRAQLDGMLGVSFALDRAALAAMTPRRRGTIVNVTSMVAEFPIPYLAGYNIAKAGLVALTESLMFEAAEAGIAAVDFRPGDYRTGFNRSMFAAPPSSCSASARRVARRLETLLAAAPRPERAARDLRRALARGRSGVVRSGSFFQTVLAPLGARLAPLALRRAVMARYFGVR